MTQSVSREYYLAFYAEFIAEIHAETAYQARKQAQALWGVRPADVAVITIYPMAR